ncbi:hypothetical protein Ancab_019613 [Ancistrocladus abbreviatus]
MTSSECSSQGLIAVDYFPATVVAPTDSGILLTESSEGDSIAEPSSIAPSPSKIPTHLTQTNLPVPVSDLVQGRIVSNYRSSFPAPTLSKSAEPKSPSGLRSTSVPPNGRTRQSDTPAFLISFSIFTAICGDFSTTVKLPRSHERASGSALTCKPRSASLILVRFLSCTCPL